MASTRGSLTTGDADIGVSPTDVRTVRRRRSPERLRLGTIASMRSMAPRAWAAMAGSTVTRGAIRSSDNATFSSVIFFMYGQTAASDAARKRLPGESCSMRWMIPTSVATMKVLAADAAARRTIPSVEVTTVAGPRRSPDDIRYSVDEVHPHSGWISSSASGCSRRMASRRSGWMPACTWHSPIQTCIFRPVTRSRWAPRNISGQKRISRSAGIERITASAFDEVQQ